MADCSLTLVAEAVSLWLSAVGSEIAGSRRLLDLSAVSAVRVVYGASLGVAIRVEYSDDLGSTWRILTTQAAAQVAGVVYRSTWEPLPDIGPNDVLLRAWGSGGLTPQITFVELQYR